ncbi:hypothetical protein SP4011_01300 [Streptococcus parapneumoniae]|uniref:Uncharacterized protein n=1 Tax=Streptococcus parapneumoniae TaxID=2993430 RepID=A0ABN6THA2_9STRE|nr:hypothetical protein [Streptococcus oralis]BDT63713.1 hypothetical protein SP4011_01300 [Streptococcus sp. SP4011]
MTQLEKSFTGLEKSLSGEQQDFIDYFSEFLKKAPDFNLKTTADDDSLNTITKRILSKVSQPGRKKQGYGTKEIKDDLRLLIEIAKVDELYRVGYAEITKAVLEVDKNRKDIPDKLGDFLEAIKNEYLDLLREFKASISSKAQLSLMDSYQQKAIICVGKAIEHARLAHIQYDSLYLETQTELSGIQKSLKEADEKLKEADEKLNDYQTEIDRLSKKQTSMYTDFIAILGVFSAFVFVMFGGFDSLAKILEGLQNNDVSIRKILLISSILIGFLITILYSLMYWVSVIIEKPILQKSCECKNVCWHPKHLYARHRFYLTLMIVCAIVFSFSLLVFK